MPFLPHTAMGARELAWGFLLACDADVADQFKKECCTYDPEIDVVVLQVEVEAPNYSFTRVRSAKVRMEFTDVLVRMRDEYPHRLQELLKIVGVNV